MWILYAVLSAFFAALVSILTKVALGGVNSNLAVAIRTVVVLGMAWVVVWVTGTAKGLHTITKREVWFLVFSGLATGFSWLFYFKALQIGLVSKVAAIDKLSIVLTIILAFVLLKEPLSWQAIVGGGLITAGTFVLMA